MLATFHPITAQLNTTNSDAGVDGQRLGSAHLSAQMARDDRSPLFKLKAKVRKLTPLTMPLQQPREQMNLKLENGFDEQNHLHQLSQSFTAHPGGGNSSLIEEGMYDSLHGSGMAMSRTAQRIIPSSYNSYESGSVSAIELNENRGPVNFLFMHEPLSDMQLPSQQNLNYQLQQQHPLLMQQHTQMQHHLMPAYSANNHNLHSFNSEFDFRAPLSASGQAIFADGGNLTPSTMNPNSSAFNFTTTNTHHPVNMLSSTANWLTATTRTSMLNGGRVDAASIGSGLQISAPVSITPYTLCKPTLPRGPVSYIPAVSLKEGHNSTSSLVSSVAKSIPAVTRHFLHHSASNPQHSFIHSPLIQQDSSRYQKDSNELSLNQRDKVQNPYLRRGSNSLSANSALCSDLEYYEPTVHDLAANTDSLSLDNKFNGYAMHNMQHQTSHGMINSMDGYTDDVDGTSYAGLMDNNQTLAGISNEGSSARNHNNNHRPKKIRKTAPAEVSDEAMSSDPDYYGFKSESSRKLDSHEFNVYILASLRAAGRRVDKLPCVDRKTLNFWALYHAVLDLGGYKVVTIQRKWKRVADLLKLRKSLTSSSFTLRTYYEYFLGAYDEHVLAATVGANTQGAVAQSNKQVLGAPAESPSSKQLEKPLVQLKQSSSQLQQETRQQPQLHTVKDNEIERSRISSQCEQIAYTDFGPMELVTASPFTSFTTTTPNMQYANPPTILPEVLTQILQPHHMDLVQTSSQLRLASAELASTTPLISHAVLDPAYSNTSQHSLLTTSTATTLHDPIGTPRLLTDMIGTTTPIKQPMLGMFQFEDLITKPEWTCQSLSDTTKLTNHFDSDSVSDYRTPVSSFGALDSSVCVSNETTALGTLLPCLSTTETQPIEDMDTKHALEACLTSNTEFNFNDSQTDMINLEIPSNTDYASLFTLM
ncbi:hypothetical protein BDV3_004674 [Batrachochytrium dendrobatidis]